jgi:hypothetical protein
VSARAQCRARLKRHRAKKKAANAAASFFLSLIRY